MTGRSEPSEATVRSALALACRAPSVHNSQPWRWKLGEHSVHLFLDRYRLLPVLDPTGRETVISCGAALHHARIALAAEGWRTIVHLLPNPAQLHRLASLEFSRMTDLDTEAVALAGSAMERRTDRRPFLPDPVPRETLTLLAEAAQAEHAVLRFALEDGLRRELMAAIEHAGSAERARPEYRDELAAWSGWHAAAEGVPAQSIPAEQLRETPHRDFDEGELPVPVLGDGAVLAVLASTGDSFESWLAAGQALSAVLLAATREGLSTCTLSQISEIVETRNQVREHLLANTGVPQLAVRIGWPVAGELPGPATPRRALSDCVEKFRPRG
jgi:nitroreductase